MRGLVVLRREGEGRTGRSVGFAMAAREAAETMGRGLRQSVSASGGHVPVKAAKTLQQRLLPDDVHPADAVDVVHALSRLIEDEELRYEALVGDNGGSHRAGYAIGRILSVVQDDVSGVDVVSKFCLDALTSPSASAKTQAAGLRLLCSVVSVTGFQFPLTDERLIDRLTAWALGPMQTHADAAPRTARREAFEAAETAEAAAVDAERENAPTAGLARQAANTANLEALRVKTYAMGCLAVALEAEDVASALVRDGVMGEIMTPLRSFLVDNEPAEGVSVVEAAAKQGTDGGESGGTVTQDARTAAHYDALLNTDDAEDVGTAGAALADFSVKRGAGDAWLLPGRLLAARLRALAATGEYIECFGQALQGGAVDVGMALVTGKYWNPESNANANKGWPPETARRRVLTGNPGNGHQNPNDSEKCVCAPQLPESLAAVCALLAHAKFAVTFVDRGGVAALLRVPRGPLSVDESYRCLFAVSQTPSAMERLLAPGRDTADTGPNVAKRCVNFVLAALDGGHEAARRHAALFLALSFPFPAVVDAFDAAGGLRPLLNLLRHAAQRPASPPRVPRVPRVPRAAAVLPRAFAPPRERYRFGLAGVPPGGPEPGRNGPERAFGVARRENSERDGARQRLVAHGRVHRARRPRNRPGAHERRRGGPSLPRMRTRGPRRAAHRDVTPRSASRDDVGVRGDAWKHVPLRRGRAARDRGASRGGAGRGGGD